MATARRTRGETYAADCTVCGRQFTYVYLSGRGPKRCDDCTPSGKLNMRYQRTGQPAPERSYTCARCGRDAVHSGAGQLPRRCLVCRGITAPAPLAGAPEPQATEPPSELPRAEPQPVVPAPQIEAASVSLPPAEEEAAAPVELPLSVGEQRRLDRQQIAAANARLAEEDQRRVAQRVQRERSDVQLLRRANDYDYVLVDGVPLRLPTATSAAS